jgi:ankyrin repeat protein
MSERVLDDFLAAIDGNDSTMVKAMLSSRAVDANARLAELMNAPVLVRAAFKANVDIVELLLNAGARIDDVDNFGNSACHFAAVGNRVETMRLLLTHRPNLALLRNLYGKTVLQEAIHAFSTQYVDKSDDLVMFLIRSGASLLDLNRGDWCRLAAISKATLQLAMDRNVVVGELRGRCASVAHVSHVARQRIQIHVYDVAARRWSRCGSPR